MDKDRIKVVVVDDDASFARSLERLLRASGFEARTYASAEAFLAAAPLPQTGCLVLDIQLSGMSGLDLQRRLHELGNSTPIIFVTAHDDMEVREQARRAGCSAYLLKPVPREAIVGAVTQAVHLRRTPQ